MFKAERAAGVLFLLSTSAFLIGSGMLEPILRGTDVLTTIDSDRTSVFAGLFLELVNAVAVVGIAVLLHPILKKQHESLAMGYYASRVIESILLIVSLIGPLVLLALSKQSAIAGTAEHSYLLTLGALAVEAHFLLFELAMIALGIGSLLLCYLLYRARLVPRALSVIGFLGYMGLITSGTLSIVGIDAGDALYIPGAIFELAFPVWLIVKGFNHPAGMRET